MPDPRRLILVTGPSGAGKTTLARALSKELGLPAFIKDDLKETLFDVFPEASPEERARFGVASFAMLERLARATLPYASVIVEANFDGRFASLPWQGVLDDTAGEARLIILEAPNARLLERIGRRAVLGDRHPGHEARSAGEDPAALTPLRIDAPTLVLDATEPIDTVLHRALIWLRSDQDPTNPIASSPPISGTGVKRFGASGGVRRALPIQVDSWRKNEEAPPT